MTSEHTTLVRMGLDDDLSSHYRLESMLEDSLVSDEELASNPPSEEASPSRQRPSKVFLPNEWLIHYFLANISDKVSSRLRPRFQIPDDVPIKKGDIREKCYTRRSSDVGFYETAFIAELSLPLSSLHHRLATYMGKSVSQIAPKA